MMNYNYYEAVIEDVKSSIHDRYDGYDIIDALQERDDFEDQLNDDLWIDDSVTGNGSGSYTFNSYKAKEYITDNLDLLREALQEFCVDGGEIAEHFLEEDWEYFDVTIRYYLLPVSIENALDELEEEFAEEIEEAKQKAEEFDDFCGSSDCDTCPFNHCSSVDECMREFLKEKA